MAELELTPVEAQKMLSNRMATMRSTKESIQESSLGSQELDKTDNESEIASEDDESLADITDDELLHRVHTPKNSLAIPEELPQRMKLPAIGRGATRVKNRLKPNELSHIASRATLRTADLIGKHYKSW
jgi:hypothetical protein